MPSSAVSLVTQNDHSNNSSTTTGNKDEQKITTATPAPLTNQKKQKMDQGALGFSGDERSELSSTQKVICGGVAGSFCRLVTNPFDLIKIRFQVQAEPIASNVATQGLPASKYTSLRQAFKAIYREEGFRGYYKGHLNGQLLSISNGIVQYGIFEQSSKMLYSMGLTNSHYNAFVAGYFSAFAAIFICYPVDLFRTRFSSQPNYYYTSIRHASKTIYQMEGLAGFYKGVLPAMFSQAPQASIFFGLYSVLKQIYDSSAQTVLGRDSQLAEIDITRTTVCSFSAGIISKIMLYPMDLIKKRMQIQGFGEGRAELGKTYVYRNSLDCARQIVRYEGLTGLYKGLLPGLAKAAVVSSSSLLAYEIVKNALVTFNHQSL